MIFIGIIAVAIFSISKIRLNSINKRDIDVTKFIQAVDEASDNKIQANWKYVCAILGVKEENKFENISEDEIKEVANLFIYKSQDSYKLKTLDDVMKKMDFSDKQKKKAEKYVNDLEYFGLTPDRLNENTKYAKFIKEIKSQSIENYKKYKILPSITIAQAILESGWGESDLSKKFNNLFGIKADPSWQGDFVTLETSEYNGIKINDKFRAYEEKSQSIADHGQFLVENKRYENHGVFDAKTYINQAKALEEAGYSTVEDEDGNKIYAKSLISLIQQYNLQIIDSIAQMK